MPRISCRGCESDQLDEFLDLGEMPLAGGFLRDENAIAGEKLYPLPVHVCSDCGLVQILEAIDPEVLFQDYSFSSSSIGPLVQHFQDYAHWLKKNLNPETAVEFGCNDGVLLRPLEELGVRTCGVDVSLNISELARKKELDVIAGYFDEETAESIKTKLGTVDVVTGSNAFAHNDQPGKILQAARRLLKPAGHLCLEVMYAGDLLQKMQWDTLYHEHLTFYGLSSLSVLLNRHGFHVIAAERLPMHGGSLRVVAGLNASEPQNPSVAETLDYERSVGLASPGTWTNFGKAVDRKITVVRETLDRLSRASRIWGYGAAGKATLWVNACKMDYLGAMVDASPLRAGKLMPGIHTPVVAPEELRQGEAPDYVFITAWNYADLIRSKEAWYEGIWLVPAPDLRFF